LFTTIRSSIATLPTSSPSGTDHPLVTTGGGPLDALRGLRVVDISDGAAGAYCAKLLADAGADVLKLEPPGGHPLRSWSVSGSVGHDGEVDGVLFRHLAAGQRSEVVDLESSSGCERALELVAESDVVIESFPPHVLESRRLGFEQLRSANPTITMVSITPFGQEGPRHADQRSEFLLQALVGSLRLHGGLDDPPVAVGGRLGEWSAGAYAGAGALAARARSERTGIGEHVDVSILECLAVTFLAYPSLLAALPGGSRELTMTMVPGIERCKDGYIGLATITVQQWHDVLAMMGRHDLVERVEWNDQRTRQRHRGEVCGELNPWLMEHTVAEILELAAAFRVPAAPVGNGANVTDLPHLVLRELFRPNPRGGFPDPRPPFRTTRTPPQAPRAAPALGEHDAAGFGPVAASPRGRTAPRGSDGPPLEGVRVVDLTSFWAGPFATQYLATLGADVIKVESAQRPDPMRFNVSVPMTTDQWYERGSLYLSVNLNKRGITLDLTQPRGRELLLSLVATADVVIENFTPRVMDQFGLTYDTLRSVRPDLVYLRMPGWGLEGPWRDRPAFASTMEQTSGMAWITGWPDGPPMLAGICDALAGVHGAFAVLAALEQRRHTGEGQQIELAMLDMSMNIAVEQILEYGAYGHLMAREGNRGPTAAPQGVYPCAQPDTWLALAVGTLEEWQDLCRALANPQLEADEGLASVEGRRAAHDRIDREITSWCESRTLDEALGALRAAGVPTEPVASPCDIDHEQQMLARGFWEEVDHPVVGRQRYPGWPMRLSGGQGRWYRSAAPLLGQHSEEILRHELGLTDEDLTALRATNVIGDRVLHR
jgi:crotonobetainyl-CoA:carnitine CoA-transferase CaiB-like acyl-CoA transferase